MDTILIEWNIRDEIRIIVTDNAASMIKTAEILKIRHIPCFAHTLNLTVTDIFDLSDFNCILKKCKDIATYFHSSSIASDKLKVIQRQLNKPELKLIQQCPTRWNSAYAMINRIFHIRQELTLAIHECGGKAPSALSAEDYDVIEDIIQLLEPFDVATNTVSGESYTTSSYVIPLIRGMTLKLSQLEYKLKTFTGKQIYGSLRNFIKNRLKPYELRTDLILATILDPRFKKLGFKTEGDANIASQCLQNEYSTFLKAQRSAQSQPVPELITAAPIVHTSNTASASASNSTCQAMSLLTETEVKLLKAKELLFAVPGGRSTTRAQAQSCSLSDAIIDIRQYLEKPPISNDECPFEYWRGSNLELKKLAEAYLSIPATSVPAERIFSKAGIIHNERRNRLKAKRLNELLFLSQNTKYFEMK